MCSLDWISLSISFLKGAMPSGFCRKKTKNKRCQDSGQISQTGQTDKRKEWLKVKRTDFLRGTTKQERKLRGEQIYCAVMSWRWPGERDCWGRAGVAHRRRQTELSLKIFITKTIWVCRVSCRTTKAPHSLHLFNISLLVTTLVVPQTMVSHFI